METPKTRDERLEDLERYVARMSPESRKGIKGIVTQWTRELGAHNVPASQSLMAERSSAQEAKRLNDIETSLEFDAPPIIKRTREQRLESMVKRLKSANPATVEPILAQIAGEYWKAGMPVTVADLQRVAAHFLNRTERRT